MLITDVAEWNKSRSKVYIDREFAFVLYKGELPIYGIHKDEELSQENYHKIMHELLPKRAKLRAMNLLQKKSYTTDQLRRKLAEGFYPEQIIEEALAYVASFHYTDDLQYAIDYITYHQESRSRKRMEQDLMKKGISAALFEKAWNCWLEDGGQQDEEAMIFRALSKKGFQPEECSAAEKGKLYQYLLRKGFSTSAINRVMREYTDNEWNCNEDA